MSDLLTQIADKMKWLESENAYLQAEVGRLRRALSSAQTEIGDIIEWVAVESGDKDGLATRLHDWLLLKPRQLHDDALLLKEPDNARPD